MNRLQSIIESLVDKEADSLSEPKSTKHEKVEQSYNARNVYESDCTSTAASDTGTLPKSSNAKRYSHPCTYKGCSFSFSRPWRLAAHIRKHKGERPFKCTFENCTRDYTNSSHLRRHVVRNHSGPKEKLSCPSPGCFLKLADAATLKLHIGRKHGPTSFNCNLCKESFRKHGDLRIHKLTHQPSLEVIFICSLCNAGFNDKRLYKKHCRGHRTYKCTFTDCEQVFNVWTIFLKHVKKDHPAAKYTCVVCNRSFSVKNNLAVHLETHKDISERDMYGCKFSGCKKFYTQQRNLAAHVKRCHLNDTYDCHYPDCNTKLSTQQKLNQHMEKKHGVITTKNLVPEPNKGAEHHSDLPVILKHVSRH